MRQWLQERNVFYISLAMTNDPIRICSCLNLLCKTSVVAQHINNLCCYDPFLFGFTVHFYV